MNEVLQTHDYIFSFGLVAMVALMVTPPLPAPIIKFFVLANIVLAVVVSSMLSGKKLSTVQNPSFSTLLSIATIFRLAVDLSLPQLFVRAQWLEIKLISIFPPASNKSVVVFACAIATVMALMQVSCVRKLKFSLASFPDDNTHLVLASKFLLIESLVVLILVGINFLATVGFIAFQSDGMSLYAIWQWAQITIFTLLPCLLAIVATSFYVTHQSIA